jgi:DNA polymerase-1
MPNFAASQSIACRNNLGSKAKDRIEPARKPPFLAVDGDSFAHRSYHALPKSIRRQDGRPGGAILGFANVLIKLYLDERPAMVLVGWDTLVVQNHRQMAFPAYQSGRVFDDELLEQLTVIPKFVEACGFANAKAPGFEADDFLAAAVAREEKCLGRVIVASGDRDAFQLASDFTTIIYPIKAGEMARIGPSEVQELYGVAPMQVPDFIALRGDPSDRIPGAKGVGARTAASLLRKYGSLERALAEGRFAQQADELRLYRRIATMDRTAPLPKLRKQPPQWARASAMAQELGFIQLANRLAGLSQTV